MARYIKWDNVVSRYKRIGELVDDVEMEDTYINYAEAYVDGQLATVFTIPFSNNNATVKDLCIDITFAKTQMVNDSDKFEEIMIHVGSYIAALKSGAMVMVVDSGVTITMNGEVVYSKNMDYVPVFGKGNVIDFKVDSAQLYDEGIERDS